MLCYTASYSLEELCCMIQTAPAMLQHCLLNITFGCLALQIFIVDGLLAADLHKELLHKRQPATIQQQGNINVVSAPGQQTQNATSTAGKGNGTDPDPGVITNPGATPISEEVNCSDPTTGRDNKCWEQLKLTEWVENWVDDNRCYHGEAFASCFLRKEGFPGLDCTGIKIDACTAPQGDNVLKEPEVFYVAYNIYGKYCEFSGLRCRVPNDIQGSINSSSHGGLRSAMRRA